MLKFRVVHGWLGAALLAPALFPALALTSLPAHAQPVPQTGGQSGAGSARSPAPGGQPAGTSAAAPRPAGPHDPDESDESPEIRAGDIVVSANRLPGQVDAPQKPVTTLEEEDVEAYGASSIADLLDAISPQTGSGRGRGGGMPVILVNGQRIASFRELRDYPPEAIRRVEILPEEVALRYGYPPDQRVVNFILKDHYASKTVEAQARAPVRGGTATEQGQLSMLRIDGNSRLNLALKADRTSPLTEAERGVIQTSPSVPPGTATPTVTVPTDPASADARTLVAKARDYSANATWTIGLGGKGPSGKGNSGPAAGSLALNASASRADTTALSGLTSVLLAAPAGSDPATAYRTLPGALARVSRTDTLQAGAALNKSLGQWQLSATIDGTHAQTATRSDNRFDTRGLVAQAAAGTLSITGPLPALSAPPQDVARSTSNSVTSLVTMTGHPLRLPGGEVATTLKAGFAWTGLTSSAQLASRESRFQQGDNHLSRGDASVGLNIGIPITSRRSDFGSKLGDISLNLSAGLDRLSDFGTLKDWSAGLTWGVTQKLSLQASTIVNQAAPSLSQLGGPVTQTFNVPVFDFTTNQSVLVTTTSGGNPTLARQQQRDFKIGLNWQLPFLNNSNLIVEYFNNHSSYVSAGFPLLTPAVEAAYPGRVIRSGGVIVAIDQRPVTLASQHEARLRWGLNLGGNLGKALPAGGRFGIPVNGGPPPGGGDGPPPGADGGLHEGRPHEGGPRGGGGRGPRYEGRWNIALYHTVQFVDRVQLAPGTPELDLLSGDAIASNGGVARHTFELDAGTFYKGLGLRFNGTWSAPTHVHTGVHTGVGAVVGSGASDLRFGSVTKLNARLFADLGQQKRLVDAHPFFKGARVSLLVNNVFDSRQRVTDASGQTPLFYQPDLIDPLGRVIGVEFRKLF